MPLDHRVERALDDAHAYTNAAGLERVSSGALLLGLLSNKGSYADRAMRSLDISRGDVATALRGLDRCESGARYEKPPWRAEDRARHSLISLGALSWVAWGIASTTALSP